MKMEEGGTLSTQYRKQISKLFTILTTLKDWKYIGDTADKIQLFKCDQYIKMECILRCSMTRFGKAIGDTSIVTREQWDKSMETLTRLEQFDQVELINWNHSLRVQWMRSSATDSVLIVQVSTFHPVFRGDPDAELNDSLIWIKELEPNKCFLTYIGLHQLTVIRQCEALCQQDEQWRSIYALWKCPTCCAPDRMNPPHELECRLCKTERFGRCVDKQCFLEQRRGAKVCEKCGGSLSVPFQQGS